MVLLACSCKEKEIILYENGTVEFEIEKKNGVRHGVTTEYYFGGKVRFVQNWKMGQLDGKTTGYYSNGNVGEETYYKNGKKVGKRKIYFESGKLMEEQIYDDVGRLVNFHSFLETGQRDSLRQKPIFFLEKDTVALGESNTFFARLGNVDSLEYSRGKLYLSSGIDKNEKLIDTIAVVTSHTNTFSCRIENSNRKGNHILMGRLQFTIHRNGETVRENFLIGYPYFVK